MEKKWAVLPNYQFASFLDIYFWDDWIMFERKVRGWFLKSRDFSSPLKSSSFQNFTQKGISREDVQKAVAIENRFPIFWQNCHVAWLPIQIETKLRLVPYVKNSWAKSNVSEKVDPVFRQVRNPSSYPLGVNRKFQLRFLMMCLWWWSYKLCKCVQGEFKSGRISVHEGHR